MLRAGCDESHMSGSDDELGCCSIATAPLSLLRCCLLGASSCRNGRIPDLSYWPGVETGPQFM
jgi:hypothetical protein